MHLVRLLIVFKILLVWFTHCKCSLFFPASSAYGIFAAIAVPLDLPPRNVFVSYNFEANYNMPQTWNIPPVFNNLEEDDDFVSSRKSNNDHYQNITTANDSAEAYTELPKNSENRKKRDLLSRVNLYRILRDKLQRGGFKGKVCLLRLICESNASKLGEVNGVLGSILHIILSPSTSQFEELPLSYYQAEHNGLHGNCQQYEQDCEEGILDLISTPLSTLFMQMQNSMK